MKKPAMLFPLSNLVKQPVNNLNTYIVPYTRFPIVTCIMPTANRLEFMFSAIQLFLDQDYPCKELVIVDNGSENHSNLVPMLYSIRYFHYHQPATIGLLRNIACEKAAGRIILHWDDDDWYAADWISFQVSTLLNTEADICGLNHVQYYSENLKKFYFTKNIDSKKNWLCGATLAYCKSFWTENPFKDIQVGEDDSFVRNKKAKVVAHDYFRGFVARVHSCNARIREY
jgi:glycosyltransferase involved in cell wall biosynthesis